MKKNIYYLYIIIALLYVGIKIGFVAAGYLHMGAIANGVIPAIITLVAGIFALKEHTKNSLKRTWRKTVWITPILVLMVTPLFTYLKMGDQWLTEGRLPVLIIYEIFIVVQLFLAIEPMRDKQLCTIF